MSFKSIGDFNAHTCKIIELNGELYAYDVTKTNGEYYVGWRCDKYGNQLEDDKRDYKIKPILQGIGEADEDGDFKEYEMVDIEIEYL